MSARRAGRDRGRHDADATSREQDVPVERDVVLDDSDDSFPASDPPGWIAMRIGPPLSDERPERDAPPS